MAQKLIDISGNKYGMLKVIEYVGNEKWLCKCDCGKNVYATGTALRKGRRTNCGCNKKTRLVDLTWKIFGRLTVLEIDKNNSSKRVYWKCKCDCGEVVSIAGNDLKSGNTKSCGCFRKENTKMTKTTHGKRNTKLYGVWCAMKSRCSNPNDTHYKDYGERGIAVCNEWLNDFQAFYDWAISNGYKNGLEIDRKDNDKGYSPNNCRWVTRKENMNNTRENVFIAYNGETHTLSEWGDITGTPERLISQRLKNGWSEHEALFGKIKSDTKSS